MEMNDRELVTRMLAGDAAAFETFFDAYFQRLFRFALRRLGDADAAEDIVQAALAQAMRKLHTWRGEAALFSWLCTVCRREMLAHWERIGRRPVSVSLDDDPDVSARLESLIATGDNPEQQLERAELAARVQIILDYLPDRYGDVLEWKYIHGLAVADIAERLGSTEKAVESMLTRARTAFREGFSATSPQTS
jgi:RNA polymerase sigma-70 factor, ECF subfamily